MLLAVVGESCTGKTTLAQRLKQELPAEVFSGKDYLRLAKNETIAETLFCEKLKAAVSGENLIYVISEREHLRFLPEGAVVVKMTADPELICRRFALRMGGKLPEPVKQMLERKHGIFDHVSCMFHIENSTGLDAVCEQIIRMSRED